MSFMMKRLEQLQKENEQLRRELELLKNNTGYAQLQKEVEHERERRIEAEINVKLWRGKYDALMADRKHDADSAMKSVMDARNRRHVVSASEKAKMKELRDAGYTYEEIEKITGHGKTTVYRVCHPEKDY